MSGSDEVQEITAVSSSLLDVSVVSSTPSICSVSSRRVVPISAGTCVLSATQLGDNEYQEASPVAATLTIARADQSLTFPALSSVAFGDSDQILGATSTSGLTISYQSANDQVCVVTGGKVKAISVGTCSITASQSGNSLFNPATSVTRSFSISKGLNSITLTKPTSFAVGDPDAIIAVSSSAGLDVTLSSESTGTCTIISGKIHAVEPGTCSITASQLGNNLYQAAASVSDSFTILGLGSQSITFAANVMFVGEADQPLSATASSGLPVAFEVNSGSTCSIITINNAKYIRADSEGSCSITASQAGNGSYSAATPVTRSFQVALQLPQIWAGPTYSGFSGTGTVDVGTTLTLSGEDVRHAATVTFEWYRCTARLVDATNTIPVGCETETVGSGRTYLVKAGDLNRYLIMALVATNAAGTTRTWIQGTPRVSFNPAIGFEVSLSIDNGPYSRTMRGNSTQYLSGFPVGIGSLLRAKPNISMPEGVSWRVRWYQCKTPYPWSDYKYYPGTPYWQTFNGLTCQVVANSESYTVQAFSQGSQLLADVIFTGSTCSAVGSYGSRYNTECHSYLTGPYVFDTDFKEGVVVAPTISGTYKAGTYLTLNSGVYSSNSIATYGNTPTQNTWAHASTSYTSNWYSCTTASESSTSEMPTNCTSIASNSLGALLSDSAIGTYVGVKIEVSIIGRGTYFLWWSGGRLVTGTTPTFSSATGLMPNGLYSYAGFSFGEQPTVTSNWLSHPAPTLSYQWYKCPSAVTTGEGTAPNTCTGISGATSNSYRIVAVDALSYLALAIHADSGYGTSDVMVGTNKPVLSSPYNTSAPTVSYATDGSRVAAIDAGTWSGTPTPTYVYTWYWCFAGTSLSGIRTSGSNQTCWSITTGQTWVYDATNYSRHVIAVSVKASNSYGRDVEVFALWAHP